ncbi:methyltransferase [Streptomyces paromomycinus]|nr:methyltransferase [Streptomyces paromomycinus]
MTDWGTGMSLMNLLMGAMASSAVGTAAELGIADALADGPATADELAKTVEADTDSLDSVLQALTALGVFTRDADGRYANSPMSEPLRSDHPDSVRHLATLLCGLYGQAATGGLTQAVRAGTSVMPCTFGVGLYEYLDSHPDTARIFDLAMQDWTRPIATLLADNLPLDDVHTVVDVGGGNGTLLQALLSAHPHLNGICADRPDTCDRAEHTLAESQQDDLARRLTFRPTDILQDVPTGGDLYLIKNVLHDWNTTTSVQILRNIRTAMTATPRTSAGAPPKLLIIDPLAEHDSGAAFRNVIKMVVGEPRTRSRSEADIRREATEAGFDVLSITPCPADLSVITCVPTS